MCKIQPIEVSRRATAFQGIVCCWFNSTIAKQNAWLQRSPELQFYLQMVLSEPKMALPLLLARHALKLSALLIQKLVLIEEKDEEETNVKHYDLQCEGVEILIGFFKSKQQATLLKAFTNIRDKPSSPPSGSAPPTQKANGTTRRTYLNTTFTGSEYSPIRDVHFHTVRSEKEDICKESLEGSRTTKNVDLQKLLSRVRLANSRLDCSYSFREGYNSREEQGFADNYTYRVQGRYTRLEGGSGLPEKHKINQTFSGHEYNPYHQSSQVLSKKSSRRQFILQKFSKIESGLSRLGVRGGVRGGLRGQIMGEIHNIKQKLRQ